ncbi:MULTISPECIES: hypothetical protein [unclassified Leucobacter]|uniref:hypothetical protein n=1 Tax=unclassified Leucobacter TaxID=2621730 RepID=UPI0006225A19|nr:hypothetical protein [Leucobacter sp. Ag1]KKI20551.1 hypothetical protein XM48_07460 [Leucobacter sp. Ag1]
MISKPTAAAASKGAPAEVTVLTTSTLREQKPEHDEVTFEKAAHLALTEAAPEGYPLLAFKSVTEFITHEDDGRTLEYRYVWLFDAHPET